MSISLALLGAFLLMGAPPPAAIALSDVLLYPLHTFYEKQWAWTCVISTHRTARGFAHKEAFGPPNPAEKDPFAWMSPGTSNANCFDPAFLQVAVRFHWPMRGVGAPLPPRMVLSWLLHPEDRSMSFLSPSGAWWPVR